MKIIYTIAFAIMFITTMVMSIIAGGQLLSTGFNYALGTEDYCRYEAPVKDGMTPVCTTDYNNLKRELANNTAMLIVSAPLAFVFFRRMRLELKNKK